MKINNIIILLLLAISLNAQTYFCDGDKQDIEKMQVSVDSFRLLYESNYTCDKWDIQKQTDISWSINVDKIDVITLNLQGCSPLPIEITGTVETSDGFYLIDSLQDESDILIKRILGKPMTDKNGNHLPINKIYELENFNTLPTFGEWCEANKVYNYEGRLFTCVQSHNRTEHSPEITPALFTMIQNIQASTCPEWVQPLGAHDVYMKGECVTFQGNEYESVIDNNSWSPFIYPAGWKLK